MQIVLLGIGHDVFDKPLFTKFDFEMLNSEMPTSVSGPEIPSWIKNNAGWWAEGKIDDNSFIQGIQFLVKEGLINP